ncbi:MAG: hypothetical protein ACOYM3_16880 [Terrimicrobiaceae bacterium]
MKKPKTDKPADAPASGEAEEQTTNEIATAGESAEILTEEQAMRRLAGFSEEESSVQAAEVESAVPEADPKELISELEVIFWKMHEKLIRRRDLEELKAKYIQEISDFEIDPLADDAERRLSIRRSRENLIEMIDIDICKIINSPDPEKSRMRFLINDLAQCVRKALDRDIPLLCDEVRAFVKGNPVAAFLYDDQELQDAQIKNLPVFFRAKRIGAVSDNFNDLWTSFEAARLVQEFPKFLEVARIATSGERILVLPKSA